MEVKEIRNVDEIREDWLRLMGESTTATVFQHPAWVQVWKKHFVQDEIQVLILGVYRENRLVGLGVFEKVKGGVEFLGMRKVLGQEITDFGDIIARSNQEEEVWREMFRFMIDELRFTNFRFDYVREESPSFEVISKVVNETGLKLVKEKIEVSPYIDLPGSFEEYLESLNKKKRHELKRKIRRVEEVGTAQLRVITENLGEENKRKLVELVRKSSEAKREFMSEKMVQFFDDLMNAVFLENIGIIFFLEIDGKVVAAILGFRFNENIFTYNGGFDPAVKQPTGVALTGKMIEWAISNKFKKLDFLRGGERYKYDLGAKDEQLWRLTVSR